MKFGEHILRQRSPEWADYYVNYNELKRLINMISVSLQELGQLADTTTSAAGYGTSISVPRRTQASSGKPIADGTDVSQESFYQMIEGEMRKVDLFTQQQINGIRQVLKEVEASLMKNPESEVVRSDIKTRLDNAGTDYLRVEKYVNLNVTAFHKILKKHDKRLPNPCKPFYISRLHEQTWIRKDHSDIIVQMSRLYSLLRGDEEAEATDDSKQVRYVIY